MLIIYDTMTGKTQKYVEKLKEKFNIEIIKISPSLKVDRDFILVTFTFNFGNIPDSTQSFLDKNHKYIKGVSSGGNRNWGDNFAKAADRISINYNVPIINKFELAGNKSDVEKFYKECLKHGIQIHRIQQ